MPGRFDVGQLQALQLSPRDTLLHLCLHLSAHAFVQPELDIGTSGNWSRTRAPFPWTQFVARARRFRMAAICYFVLDAVASQADSGIPGRRAGRAPAAGLAALARAPHRRSPPRPRRRAGVQQDRRLPAASRPGRPAGRCSGGGGLALLPRPTLAGRALPAAGTPARVRGLPVASAVRHEPGAIGVVGGMQSARMMAQARTTAASFATVEICAVALLVAAGTVSTRVLPYAVAIAVLFWPLRWLATGRLSVRTPGDWPVGLLLLLLPVTVWATALPDVTWPLVWRLALGVALYYAIANWARTVSRLRVLGFALAGLGLLLALSAPVTVQWFGAVKLLFIPEAIYRRLPLLLGDPIHPNVMAGALVLLLPLVLAPLLFDWRGLRWGERLFLSLAGLLMAGVLVLTKSRGGLMGFAAALVVLVALRWRRGWLAIPSIAAGAGLSCLAAWPGPRARRPDDSPGDRRAGRPAGSVVARHLHDPGLPLHGHRHGHVSAGGERDVSLLPGRSGCQCPARAQPVPAGGRGSGPARPGRVAGAVRDGLPGRVAGVSLGQGRTTRRGHASPLHGGAGCGIVVQPGRAGRARSAGRGDLGHAAGGGGLGSVGYSHGGLQRAGGLQFAGELAQGQGS